jgi:Ca2+-binding EF-hand superfamily protein
MNMLIANENLFKMYDQGNKGYINAGDLRRVSQISGVELTEDEI